MKTYEYHNLLDKSAALYIAGRIVDDERLYEAGNKLYSRIRAAHFRSGHGRCKTILAFVTRRGRLKGYVEERRRRMHELVEIVVNAYESAREEDI